MDLGKEYSYTSRKFVAAILGLALITVVTVLSGKIATILPLYPTFVGGIIGVLSIYMAGNVGNKYVIGKTELLNQGSAPPSEPIEDSNKPGE